MNSWINLGALWKIVVVGLAAGAGLPALFAVGLRVLSLGSARGSTSGQSGPARASGGRRAARGPFGVTAAAICFAVVLAAIGWGIYSIIEHS